jgi:hypothetical protein
VAAASAYVLPVPEDRREIILNRAEEYQGDPTRWVAEPVGSFAHGRNAALIVLVCFRDGKITHIAKGRKGMSAGTGLVRLNMTELQRLDRPLPFEELVGLVPARFRAPLRRMLRSGGLLPAKTFAAVVDALTARDPTLAPRLARFSEQRARAIRGLTLEERQNLAVQKDSLGLALAMAGVPRTEMLSWSPTLGKPSSFLQGLPGARVREDVMILKDFTSLPGFEAIRPEGYRLGSNPFFLKFCPRSSSIPMTRDCSVESTCLLTFGRACTRTGGSRGRRAATSSGSITWEGGSPTRNSSRLFPTLGLAPPFPSPPNSKKSFGRFLKPGEP